MASIFFLQVASVFVLTYKRIDVATSSSLWRFLEFFLGSFALATSPMRCAFSWLTNTRACSSPLIAVK